MSTSKGSSFTIISAVLAVGWPIAACSHGASRDHAPSPTTHHMGAAGPSAQGEAAERPAVRAFTPRPLGRDRGIYPDLDDQVSLAPLELTGAQAKEAKTRGVWDASHGTVVILHDEWPIWVVAEGDGVGPDVEIGGQRLRLHADDAAEVRRLLGRAPIERLAPSAPPTPGDRDHDGIPDPLDVLLGGKKLLVNRAAYTGAYFKIVFPLGDPPRDQGSCVDVVIRGFRNAGVDLQRELAEDLVRAPSAYPMVKKPDANIDHRRVRTLWPWFKRHAEAHAIELDQAADPYRPGDVLFMDTIPSKAGPDHVGLVSDQRGPSGRFLVINNWSSGNVDAEMDLLDWVPVMARYRLRPVVAKAP
jgi:hypothetical protein